MIYFSSKAIQVYNNWCAVDDVSKIEPKNIVVLLFN